MRVPRQRRGDELPRPGDLLHVTSAASVQFARPIWFRVISAHDAEAAHGWAWLDGYQLDAPGEEATARRSIFVRPDGLRAATEVRV